VRLDGLPEEVRCRGWGRERGRARGHGEIRHGGEVGLGILVDLSLREVDGDLAVALAASRVDDDGRRWSKRSE
jgi:hypothetical protein